MSTAFLLGTGGANEDPWPMIRFYERDIHVRRAFAKASAQSGIPVDVLLRKRDVPGGGNVMLTNNISLAAGMLGIHDALCAVGVCPDAIGGMSLGSMVASALTGALSRRTMTDILLNSVHRPASAAPELREAIGFVFVRDGDSSRYHGLESEGVYVAADFGPSVSGEGRMLMLSGYRRALESLAERDDNHVRIREEHLACAAYHTPLREHARASLSRYLSGVHFAAPTVPLCAPVGAGALVTAGDVRGMFLANLVEPLRMHRMVRPLRALGTSLAVAIGPSMRRGLFDFPFPVVHVDAPEYLADAVAAAEDASARREQAA